MHIKPCGPRDGEECDLMLSLLPSFPNSHDMSLLAHWLLLMPVRHLKPFWWDVKSTQ